MTKLSPHQIATLRAAINNAGVVHAGTSVGFPGIIQGRIKVAGSRTLEVLCARGFIVPMEGRSAVFQVTTAALDALDAPAPGSLRDVFERSDALADAPEIDIS